MFKKHLGFSLNIIALLLFIPGIILPMFSFEMAMQAQLGQSALSAELINKNLSLLGTIQELWQDDRLLVSVLILLFSIVIPIVKSLLMFIAYWYKHSQLEKSIYDFVAKIGKWSMADVFVVAIFLAILSTNHAETSSEQTLSVFGFKLQLLLSSESLSNLGLGFYYFTGYCLLSLAATQISQSSLTTKNTPAVELLTPNG